MRTEKQFWKMTPGQLQHLINVHNIFNEPDEDKRKRLIDGRGNPSKEAIYVDAQHAPAIISMLGKQKLSKRK